MAQRKPAARKVSPRKPAAHKPLRRKPSARASSSGLRSARKGPRRAPAAATRAAAALPAFRFKPGDRVRTRQDVPRGHCRTPYYLRGQPGVIERCLGHYRNPETRAYGKTGLPKVGLYTVRYVLPRLWQGYSGARADTLVADLFEFWLDPA